MKHLVQLVNHLDSVYSKSQFHVLMFPLTAECAMWTCDVGAFVFHSVLLNFMSNSAEVGRFVFVLENADCFLFCARWHHSCCVGFVNTVFYFSGVYSRLGRESRKVGNGKLLEINFLGDWKKKQIIGFLQSWMFCWPLLVTKLRKCCRPLRSALGRVAVFKKRLYDLLKGRNKMWSGADLWDILPLVSFNHVTDPHFVTFSSSLHTTIGNPNSNLNPQSATVILTQTVTLQ